MRVFSFVVVGAVARYFTPAGPVAAPVAARVLPRLAGSCQSCRFAGLSWNAAFFVCGGVAGAAVALLHKRRAPALESTQQELSESWRNALSPAEEEKPTKKGCSYMAFAQHFPFANNIAIATAKTGAADLLAQVVIAHTPLDAIDWQRSLLFCAFGAIYLGGFQYFYQVKFFRRLFDVDAFTAQPWEKKLRDRDGLLALAAQTALDLAVLSCVYLPTFYVFKASVFSGSTDPLEWASSGLAMYCANFAKDEFDLLRVWLPADLVCFSVPLYLRLPVRHLVSFVWTAYLSFARGGH
jgi:hypothetical protein